MQEIQRFSDDNGNVHRLIASTDGGKEGVSLETTCSLQIIGYQDSIGISSTAISRLSPVVM